MYYKHIYKRATADICYTHSIDKPNSQINLFCPVVVLAVTQALNLYFGDFSFSSLFIFNNTFFSLIKYECVCKCEKLKSFHLLKMYFNLKSKKFIFSLCTLSLFLCYKFSRGIIAMHSNCTMMCFTKCIHW